MFERTLVTGNEVKYDNDSLDFDYKHNWAKVVSLWGMKIILNRYSMDKKGERCLEIWF